MGVHTLETKLPLRIITFNIRFAAGRPVAGEAPWAVRCPRLVAQLRFLASGAASFLPTFVCLQEALAGQVRDVLAGLGEGWAHVGVGRDDGVAAGEFSPVLYHAGTWRCARSQTYWLSPTPTKAGSRGWDAALPRIVTMGQFVRRDGSNAKVVVLSTHFDHRGVRAREESARLILELARQWVDEDEGDGDDDDAGAATKTNTPVFLGGDFNSTPSDRAYQTMTAAEGGMTDISTLFGAGERHGHELTYSSFGEPGEVPKRIDFLFVRDPSAAGGIAFRTFGVLANRFDDGVFLSDHRAVVADVEISFPAVI